MKTSNDWYKRASCKIHLDMHCPEWHESILENFDAKNIVEQVVAADADALYFFAKDHYGNAYYQTEVGHRHRALEGRDFLAEILAEARRFELPIMAYFSVIWDNHAAQAHPEWCMRNPAGAALSDTITSDQGKWQYVCHNSGYVEQLSQMIDEVASQYRVAGFHLDMLNYDFGGQSCYCDNCRTKFRERTGHDIPVEPSWDAPWHEFLEFRYESVELLFEKLKQTALRHDPESCVVMNYHASPNFDWRVGQQPVRHSVPGALGTGETYTPAFGDLYPGMESRFIRSIAPGKPFELVAWRMNRITDFTVKPREQLRWEILTCLQHQGSIMLIDQPRHDGQLDPVAYDRVREVFQEAHQLKPYFQGEFIPYVGLYYSARSRDRYARGEQEKFLLPIMGAYKALVESHVPVDFVFDETLTKHRLAQFPVIVLPNVGALSEPEVQLLSEYVRDGGNLIATLDSSLYSDLGDPLEDFQLAEVFGVSYGGTIDCDNNYFSNLAEPYTAGIDPRYQVLNQGRIHRVERRTAAGVGDLHDAF
ncbi:MAG: beta-galactosidase trimerization domain-containing protein, partial [Aeoliella sp.]